MDANHPRQPGKESASCPMDFILRMLMGPWTTYILYNLQDPRPAALRRAEAPGGRHLGQDADRAAAHARRRGAWCGATTRRRSRPRSPIRSPSAATSSTTCWASWPRSACAGRPRTRAARARANERAEGGWNQTPCHFGTLKCPCTKLRSMNDLGSASRDDLAGRLPERDLLINVADIEPALGIDEGQARRDQRRRLLQRVAQDADHLVVVRARHQLAVLALAEGLVVGGGAAAVAGDELLDQRPALGDGLGRR